MHRFSPVVISFYTLRTPYQQEVLHLMDSVERWGIEARIEGRESLGSWEHNCAYKPRFILQKLKELKRAILWVDADAIFHASPKWSEFIHCDLSLRINPSLGPTHGSKILSGTLFVNYSAQGLALIEQWIEACEKGLRTASALRELFGPGCYFWDQAALNEILWKNKKLRVHNLPLAYCKIFDLDKTAEVIIEHHQASRRFKHLIGT
jgi:hypothetical protein